MKRIEVLKENENGRNIKFRDNYTREEMTRRQFVREIERGNYKEYHIRIINDVKTPVSNPNKNEKDNLD